MFLSCPAYDLDKLVFLSITKHEVNTGLHSRALRWQTIHDNVLSSGSQDKC